MDWDGKSQPLWASVIGWGLIDGGNRHPSIVNRSPLMTLPPTVGSEIPKTFAAGSMSCGESIIRELRCHDQKTVHFSALRHCREPSALISQARSWKTNPDDCW